MSDRADTITLSSTETYSPQLRTALVLTGTGTAGAYHAGVVRALHEAGVKIDIVAGRGIGVVGALFDAIDGAQCLWDHKGFWRSPAVQGLYPWRAIVQVAAWAIAVAIAVVTVPVAIAAIGAIVFPIDFVARMIGLGGAVGVVGWYVNLAQSAFAPAAFPTWLPRVAVLVLGLAALAMTIIAAMTIGPRRQRGPIWWRALPSPLSATRASEHCWRVMWDLLRGAAPLKQPPAAELGRRYMELLVDNIGQPGFRELLFIAHDLDAQRDLVFAAVAESRRRDLFRRPTSVAAEARRAEVFDLAGTAREHLADAVAAALTIPLATDAHAIAFAPDAYWRGETHRLCDRPASLVRILEELVELGVAQAIVVSAAPQVAGPHTLAARRLDGRGRLGEYLQSNEAAVVRDATRQAAQRIGAAGRLFTIQPAHNAVGPFDFRGGYDDRSDRRQPLAELMSSGYEDAYRQFIEPVVGASGEVVANRTSQAAGRQLQV